VAEQTVPAARVSAWSRLVGAVDALWKPPLDAIETVGAHLVLLGQVIFWTLRRPFRARVFLEAADFVGFPAYKWLFGPPGVGFRAGRIFRLHQAIFTLVLRPLI